MNYKLKYSLFLLALINIFFGCKEEFTPETETNSGFKSALVVEASISDSLKVQKVQISRTTPLENRNISLENGAKVMVQSSDGQEFTYSQNSDGFYYSNKAFKAEDGNSYQLYIQTSDGEIYTSSKVELPKNAVLDKFYGKRIIKDGVEGIQIYADSKGVDSLGSYFRYSYEETYKIVTPDFNKFKATIVNIVNNGEEYDVEITPRENDDGKICYSTHYSQGINQISTSNLTNNEALEVPIRFIPADDPIIRERYSIKISQYTESNEAFSFYKILNDLGNSESILSQNQPGAIEGNISNINNTDELVLGYFSANLEDAKRIFFNYEDFDLPRPPYFYECKTFTYDYLDNYGTAIDGDLNEREALYMALKKNDFTFYSQEGDQGTIYTVVRPECGDCTSFASKIKPEFWID